MIKLLTSFQCPSSLMVLVLLVVFMLLTNVVYFLAVLSDPKTAYKSYKNKSLQKKNILNKR